MLLSGHPPADLVEGKTEESPVERMDREARRSRKRSPRNQLAEKQGVGVVAAEHAPVERLEEAPGRRGEGAGESRVNTTFLHDG